MPGPGAPSRNHFSAGLSDPPYPALHRNRGSGPAGRRRIPGAIPSLLRPVRARFVSEWYPAFLAEEQILPAVREPATAASPHRSARCLLRAGRRNERRPAAIAEPGVPIGSNPAAPVAGEVFRRTFHREPGSALVAEERKTGRNRGPALPAEPAHGHAPAQPYPDG